MGNHTLPQFSNPAFNPQVSGHFFDNCVQNSVPIKKFFEVLLQKNICNSTNGRRNDDHNFDIGLLNLHTLGSYILNILRTLPSHSDSSNSKAVTHLKSG